MSYQVMENLTDGQLLTEAHMDKIRENIEFLASLTRDGAALSSLAAGAEINPLPVADYDSGWFAVGAYVEYTKAHGLAAMPRLVTVSIAATATPTTILAMDSITGFGPEISWTTTNIIIKTQNHILYTLSGNGGIWSSGFYRILAWA